MLAGLVVAVGGLCVLAWLAMPARLPQQAPRALASRLGADRAPVLAAAAVAGPETETSAARRARLAAQMQLAEHTLCSYQLASRYPDGSRPISQHPDQIYPNAPVSENRPMRRKDGSIASAILVTTTQSRVYATAGESVLLAIAAADERGNALPVTVDQATARGLAPAPGKPGAQPVTLLMADDGGGGGGVIGVLAPAESGLAGFHGTLRAEVLYRVAGQAGVAVFDVIHTPQPPAVWSGPVRESLQEGSLQFTLGARVTVPGHYIVSGRVDDATGKPLALLTFNDLLPQGENSVPLTLHGLLLRDLAPAFPLTLRDIDGYLLTDGDPDRALMPRIDGKALVSKRYLPDQFSDAEWESEQRSRYLAEFARDVERARAELAALDPEAARPTDCVEQKPQG
jgi:hypothetical protein